MGGEGWGEGKNENEKWVKKPIPDPLQTAKTPSIEPAAPAPHPDSN